MTKDPSIWLVRKYPHYLTKSILLYENMQFCSSMNIRAVRTSVCLHQFSLNIDSYRRHANSNTNIFSLSNGMRAGFLHSTYK